MNKVNSFRVYETKRLGNIVHNWYLHDVKRIYWKHTNHTAIKGVKIYRRNIFSWYYYCNELQVTYTLYLQPQYPDTNFEKLILLDEI